MRTPPLAAGALRGYGKAVDHRPEWSDWEQLPGSSQAESTGSDSMLFGDLPGFATLVRPLVAAAQPLGLLVFLALHVLSCVVVGTILKPASSNAKLPRCALSEAQSAGPSARRRSATLAP